jgi:O-antigen/teichoic acid export membrane protein
VGNGRDGINDLMGRLWGEAKSPLYRNAIFLMANSVVGQALGFFFWVVVARSYDTSDVGFAVTLFSTVSFAASLALFGQTYALIRYLPETEDQAQLINTSLTLVGLATLGFTGAFFLVVAVTGLDLGFILESPAYPLVIVAGALACSLGPILDNTAIGLRRADLPMWRTVAQGLVKIPLVVVIALTLSTTLGVGRFGIFLALVLSLVISVVVEAIWLVPKVLPGYAPRIRTQFSRLRPMMRFSQGNYAASVIAGAGGGLLPLLVLEVLGEVGARNAAYFYVASAVAGLLSVISGSAFTSFYAEASYRDADRHRDERRALLLTLALLAPAIVLFWVFAHFVLLLFGGATTSSYADFATDPLRIMTLASIPAVASNLLTTRVRVRRRTRPLIVGAAISTVVMLGLGYVLLAAYGITGLSVAYVVAGAAATPYYWLVARRSFEAEPLEPTDLALLER